MDGSTPLRQSFSSKPGRNNVALFLPENGLNPYLDLVLSARIPLQRNYNIRPWETTVGLAEIPDIDPLGSTTAFDEIQIEARVAGPVLTCSTICNSPAIRPMPRTSFWVWSLAATCLTWGAANLPWRWGPTCLARFPPTPRMPWGCPGPETVPADGLDRITHRLGGDTLGYGIGVSLGITENISATLVQVLNQSQPISIQCPLSH